MIFKSTVIDNLTPKANHFRKINYKIYLHIYDYKKYILKSPIYIND